MKTVITAAQLFTPLERIESPILIVEDGKVISVSSSQETEFPEGGHRLDYPGCVLAPGYIDVHIHGGAGHDVMDSDASALAAIEESMARRGVTSYLPTTVSAPESNIVRALRNLGAHIKMSEQRMRRARPLGIHLEGPFISHAKRGVHPADTLVSPSPERLDRFWEASDGTLRMMTIAPELDGAIETIKHAQHLGVLSSLGHSNATFHEARQGIAAGARHATHCFNAMRALNHREPGILGAILVDDQLTGDMIVDGVHIAPTVVELFVRLKGIERTVLITDAISATGMPDGKYRLGSFEVTVHADRCECEGKLAGSVLTLDRAVRNVMSFAGVDLQQAVRMATLNPAQLLGIAGQCGMLTPGAIADVVVLSPRGEVVQTIVAGQSA